jgi:hypothetical protein
MWAFLFAILAIGLAVLFAWSRARFQSGPLLVASAAWGLSALYEWWFTRIYDPQAAFNIRIDLLLVIAGSVVITLFCAVWSLRRR